MDDRDITPAVGDIFGPPASAADDATHPLLRPAYIDLSPAPTRPTLPPSLRRNLSDLLAAARWDQDAIGAGLADDVRDGLERVRVEMVAAGLDLTDRAALMMRIQADLRDWHIRNTGPLVKAVLGDAITATAQPSTTTLPTFADETPWPDPVDGAAVMAATSAIIRRHVVCSPAQADAVALWIVMTYAIEGMSIAPILLVTAATMRSGKTTLLTLLTALVSRPLSASNLTGAVLARAMAAFQPTLLADEADTWLTDEASDLRGILNAGHTRPTAYILRCAPDTHEPTQIPCFGAKALSMIRRPPATIADRSITIELRRKRTDEAVKRYRIDRLHGEHLVLRRQWRRWADDHLDEIRDSDPEVPEILHDRAADNWRPLLAIADLIGGEWPTRGRAAASELAGDTVAPEESVGVDLLRDIWVVYADRDVDFLSSTDLANALVAMPDRPWAEWSRGRPMTAAKMARMLKPFGLISTVQRIKSKTPHGYPRAAFTDAWTRYAPDLVAEKRNTATFPCKTEADPHFSEVQQIGSVALPQTANGPMNTTRSCSVAVSQPQTGQKEASDAYDIP